MEQSYQTKKSVLSPYKVGAQVSSSQEQAHSQSAQAQGSLKSHVNQLQPYSVVKAAQCRQSRRNPQSRFLPKQQPSGNPTPATVPVASKGLLRPSAGGSTHKKQASPQMNMVLHTGSIGHERSLEHEEDPLAYTKSSTNVMDRGTMMQMKTLYLDQMQALKQTQQSLWDQRIMLCQEAAQSGKIRQASGKKQEQLGGRPFQKHLLKSSLDVRADQSLKRDSLLASQERNSQLTNEDNAGAGDPLHPTGTLKSSPSQRHPHRQISTANNSLFHQS